MEVQLVTPTLTKEEYREWQKEGKNEDGSPWKPDEKLELGMTTINSETLHKIN